MSDPARDQPYQLVEQHLCQTDEVILKTILPAMTTLFLVGIYRGLGFLNTIMAYEVAFCLCIDLRHSIA